jgi:hypothetical protein
MMSEAQMSTGRYSVGQKVVAAGHLLKGPAGQYHSAGYVPGRDDLLGIHLVVLTCQLHQKVPCQYVEGSTNDGYQFVDEATGIVYNNQYPRSANGQITDTGDWTFNIAKVEDFHRAEHNAVFLRDVGYIVDSILVAQEIARSAAQKATDRDDTFQAADHLERSQLMDTYLDSLKARLAKIGFRLDFEPMVLKSLSGVPNKEPDIEYKKAVVVPIKEDETHVA